MMFSNVTYKIPAFILIFCTLLKNFKINGNGAFKLSSERAHTKIVKKKKSVLKWCLFEKV